MGESARKRHKTTPPPLSAREIRFCQLYAETGNATRSYIDAGFPHANPNAAGFYAFRLIRKDKIREYIRKIQSDAAEAAQVSIDELAGDFRRATKADLRRLMGPDGEMLPPDQWPDDVALCITRLEVEELTEMQADPDNPRRKKKVAVGTKWKVWLENKTECRKVLAQWKRMLSDEKAKPDESQKGAGSAERDRLARLDARLAALQAQSGGDSGAEGGDSPDGAVGGEPGAAGEGVPQSGG
jgi:phage terminase small subunit